MEFEFRPPQSEPEGRYCPSCGRYVGNYDICPYCGARVKVRVKIKVLAILSLFLAISGVVAVYFAANTSPPTVLVEQITPEMNYARVKIIGYVVSAPSYDEMSGYFTFRIRDVNNTYNTYFNTSDVVVNVYSPVSAELIKSGKIPIPGDFIEVIGTLKVRNYIALIVNYADDLKIIRRSPTPVTFDELAQNWSAYLGQPINVSGWIVDYSNRSTMLLLELRDYYANTMFSLQVYIPEIILRWTGNMSKFGIGDKISVVGNLWSYRGSPEIVPWNVSSISVVEPLRLVPLAEIISRQDFYAGKEVIVKVNATVVSYSSTYHNIISITDDSTNNVVTLFIDWEVWDSLPVDVKNSLNTVGYNFIVTGVCKLYKGKLEIAVYDASWILIP